MKRTSSAPCFRRAPGRLGQRAALLLLALLLFTLGGCRRSGVTQIGNVLDDWRYKESEGGTAAVEHEEMTSTDFSDTLGFAVTEQPDGEAYSLNRIWLLDGWYAQFEFSTPDERQLVLRVAPVEGNPLLTSTYAEGHGLQRQSYDYDGIEVQTRVSSDNCAIASWRRDGYQYLLHSNKRYGMPPEEDITAMVEHFIVQGNAASDSSVSLEV